MKSQHMKPQDILLLLKIISNNNDQWKQKQIAEELSMSQSEVSECVARCKYSGLLDSKGKKVFRLALMEFLQYGIAYVFPQKPGPVVKGIPTAHSVEPLKNEIVSTEHYVWPTSKGRVRGHSIEPLYPSVVKVVEQYLEHGNYNNHINEEQDSNFHKMLAILDSKHAQEKTLYEMLALVDALRVGRAREKEIALKEIKKRIQKKVYVD